MKTINNELAIVISETQVPDEMQKSLIEYFTPFLEQAADWKEKAESLVVTDITQTHEMKMAREARLALREIRLAADKTRKLLKEDSLKYGRAVQGAYNVIEAAISPIEKHLEEQEKFKELYELQQKEKLRLEREELSKDVREYMIVNINLGEITQTDFERMLNGAILQKQAAEQAAIKAEEDRQARLKEEALEREMLRVENEKLKAAAEEKERETRAELDRLEQEQRKANIAAAKLKKEAEAKLAAEKAEKECLLAELKAKEEAEAKAELERQALIEAELTKGDKAKIADMIADLEAIKTKYEFKAKKNKILYLAVISLLDKIIVYINQKN
jgi:colicin import membrane protein